MIDKREIGCDAVWSLSTAKPGNGVDQLRDDNMDTYWQSDGAQPHLVNVQFHKKVTIDEVAVYLDFKLDESYTPRKFSIRAGTTFHDLNEIHTLEVNEPQGWINIPLQLETENGKKIPLRTFFLQIAITAMHQNGRDTHARQIKIFAPRQSSMQRRDLLEPNTVEFQSYATLR